MPRGDDFDAFDLRPMEKESNDGARVLAPNGTHRLELEYDGSSLPSTAKSGMALPSRVVEVGDLRLVVKARRQRRVFFDRAPARRPEFCAAKKFALLEPVGKFSEYIDGREFAAF